MSLCVFPQQYLLSPRVPSAEERRTEMKMSSDRKARRRTWEMVTSGSKRQGARMKQRSRHPKPQTAVRGSWPHSPSSLHQAAVHRAPSHLRTAKWVLPAVRTAPPPPHRPAIHNKPLRMARHSLALQSLRWCPGPCVMMSLHASLTTCFSWASVLQPPWPSSLSCHLLHCLSSRALARADPSTWGHCPLPAYLVN